MRCQSCKWNQPPRDKSDDKTSTLFTTSEKLFLDYGLKIHSDGTQICVDNSNIFANHWVKSNCAKYDSNNVCTLCHSRKFDLDGKHQWRAPMDAGADDYLKIYRNVHFDYFLSEDNAGVKTCKRYPSHYVGK